MKRVTLTSEREELLQGYLTHLRRRGLAQNSRASYRSMLLNYLVAHDPNAVEGEAIESWLDGKTLAVQSRCVYRSAIQGFHAWLVESGRATSDPAAKLVRPKVQTYHPRPISSEALERAIASASPRMRLWLSLAAFSGLRCVEIAGLRAEEIRRDMVPPVLTLTTTKGGRPRIVPLANDVLRAMDAYPLPATGPAFPSREGDRQPLTAAYVSHRISEHLRRQGVACTAHQLRHWFGTEMYRRTRDIRLVGELMGHAKITTTALYCALVPSEAAMAAVRNLSVASQVPAEPASPIGTVSHVCGQADDQVTRSQAPREGVQPRLRTG